MCACMCAYVHGRLLPYLETSDSAAGIFYKSCMNTSSIEEEGTKPLQPFIKQVSEIKVPKLEPKLN